MDQHLLYNAGISSNLPPSVTESNCSGKVPIFEDYDQFLREDPRPWIRVSLAKLYKKKKYRTAVAESSKHFLYFNMILPIIN